VSTPVSDKHCAAVAAISLAQTPSPQGQSIQCPALFGADKSILYPYLPLLLLHSCPTHAPLFYAAQGPWVGFWWVWTRVPRKNKLFCRQQGSKYPIEAVLIKMLVFFRASHFLFCTPPLHPIPHTTLLQAETTSSIMTSVSGLLIGGPLGNRTGQGELLRRKVLNQ
jgi:hypothetical protein